MNLDLPKNRPESKNCAVALGTRLPRAAILLVSLTWGGVSLAQSTNAPAASDASKPASGTNIVTLAPTTVVGKLDVAREQIVPELGATEYTINQSAIQALPAGENTSINQVLLRAPGTAQDSAANGGLHLRGEHANLQYRVNDVLLPEGVTGFGQELSARFVDSLHLITGSLPAQYGFRTAGIVDIHTKNGAFAPGGELSMYGGKYETINPSFEVGGSEGNFNYFANGSYNHNGIGIENPTSSWAPIHDITDQYKAFTYLSYVLDDTSRISFMGSASYSDFQIPNTPGLPAGTSPGGIQWVPGNFDSSKLDENQNEQNYYGVVAYQKSVGDLNYQLAGYGRASTVHFRPDPVGDLYFDGVASDVDRRLYSGGAQFDASYALGEKHTLRGGMMVLAESLSADTTTTVFATDPNGDPIPGQPAFPIVDNTDSHALFFGLYLQDEWKILPKVTLNYGARWDLYYASFDKENQPSPRVNLIYEPTDSTTLHAGYARYFTPPPLENVNTTTIQKFDNTSNASATDQNDPVKAERANYFDAGVSQKITTGLQAGLDGYYKTAKNQLDDGLFGQTLILSSFNYEKGEIYGAEFTTSYTVGGFSTYANVAYSVARGQNWVSSQFLFDPADLAYVRDHWINLDHDQRVTGSFGASYLWKRTRGSTRVYVDAIYGSGLRTDGTAPDGSTIPNGATVPSYYSVNMGIEEGFNIRGKEHIRVRFDVVNITDNVYQLRNGAGVGVNAAQYGQRLGFFAGLSYVF
jgi:outer membrane receptor protein involved in Fe transport